MCDDSTVNPSWIFRVKNLNRPPTRTTQLVRKHATHLNAPHRELLVNLVRVVTLLSPLNLALCGYANFPMKWTSLVLTSAISVQDS